MVAESEAVFPPEPLTLEALAGIAAARNLISVEDQAKLLELNDRFQSYAAVNLDRQEQLLERHLIEVEDAGGEDALLSDARRTLIVAIALVHRV